MILNKWFLLSSCEAQWPQRCLYCPLCLLCSVGLLLYNCWWRWLDNRKLRGAFVVIYRSCSSMLSRHCDSNVFFFSTAALECVIGCCRRASSIWCEIWAGIFIWVFSIIQYCVRKSSCGWVTEISLIDVFIPPYIRHVTHPPHTRLATKLNHLYIRENWENALFMKSNLSRTLWQTTKII